METKDYVIIGLIAVIIIGIAGFGVYAYTMDNLNNNSTVINSLNNASNNTTANNTTVATPTTSTGSNSHVSSSHSSSDSSSSSSSDSVSSDPYAKNPDGTFKDVDAAGAEDEKRMAEWHAENPDAESD